jgi:hypothetical protein
MGRVGSTCRLGALVAKAAAATARLLDVVYGIL